MKTREQIYGREATGLLRDISLYRAVTGSQLIRLYPGKENIVPNLLAHLSRQGRIFYDEVSDFYYADRQGKPDAGMTAAIWVLIDFIDRVEYHSASDFPAKLIFFAAGEVYEVIHVPLTQEALINHIWTQQQEEDPPHRIVVVDNPDQIVSIDIPGTSGYCTVDADGRVVYFKKD